MSATDVLRISEMVTHRELDAGSVLVHQGTLPFDIFVIDRGVADVELDGTAIAEIGADRVVGGAARRAWVPYGATVRARTPMVVWAVDPRSARAFLRIAPHAARIPWADSLPNPGAESRPQPTRR
ncbi:MAG: cyclic nucleotide-binding domain-containing protein [Actinomycetota bacterium]|nr:cyclic nucleotide-binding domain-containing protein [Actinomycetota bacterium]